jgi:hypothetical protein
MFYILYNLSSIYLSPVLFIRVLSVLHDEPLKERGQRDQRIIMFRKILITLHQKKSESKQKKRIKNYDEQHRKVSSRFYPKCELFVVGKRELQSRVRCDK